MADYTVDVFVCMADVEAMLHRLPHVRLSSVLGKVFIMGVPQPCQASNESERNLCARSLV